MRYSEISASESRMRYVQEVHTCCQAISQHLAEQPLLEQRLDLEYAMQMLARIQKIAAYMVQSKLQNSGDIERFDSFLSLVQVEMPNLVKAFDTIKIDMENAKALSNRHPVFTKQHAA